MVSDPNDPKNAHLKKCLDFFINLIIDIYNNEFNNKISFLTKKHYLFKNGRTINYGYINYYENKKMEIHFRINKNYFVVELQSRKDNKKNNIYLNYNNITNFMQCQMQSDKHKTLLYDFSYIYRNRNYFFNKIHYKLNECIYEKI